MAKELPSEILTTSQEALFIGGSPSNRDMEILEASSEGWYRPRGILHGTHDIAQIRAAREKRGVVEISNVIAFGLSLPAGESAYIKLGELDKEGNTAEDPTVLAGVLDRETGNVAGSRDITEAYLALYKDPETSLHKRHTKGSSEGQSSGSPEGGY